MFRENRGDKTVMVVCGNKSDLEKYIFDNERNYNQADLTHLMDKYRMKFYETSALNGTVIEDMFFSIIDQINALQQAKKKKIAQ